MLIFAQPHACPGFRSAQTIPTDRNAYMGSKKVKIHGCLNGPGIGLPPPVAVCYNVSCCFHEIILIASVTHRRPFCRQMLE
jgi:hypothetical protein